MEFLISILDASPYFDLPVSLGGWLVLLALLAFVVLHVSWGRGYHPSWSGRLSTILFILFALTPFTSLFFALRLPSTGMLPPPGRPLEPVGPVLLVLAALPWMLASGLLGPLPAGFLAGLSGLVIGLYDTHSIYTPLIYAIIAVLMSVATRQRFRTFSYALWRHPLVASLSFTLLYLLLALFTTIFLVDESLSARLDFAISQVGWQTLAFGGQLLVAGVFAEIVALGWPAAWHGGGRLIPSPSERSLEARLLYMLGPLVLILAVVLMAGDWIVAGKAAREMLQERMQVTASTAAQSVPFFLETGQNLIMQLADDPSLYIPGIDLQSVLINDLRAVPYFDQLTLLDPQGEHRASYPVLDYSSLLLTAEERLGIELAMAGVSYQMYVLPPADNASAARLAFIAAVRDDSGALQGILMGRTSLSTNPFTQPILDTLSKVTEKKGAGILVDDNGMVLYHPDPALIGIPYWGDIHPDGNYDEETGANATRQLVLQEPVRGSGWMVIITIPASVAQQTALEISMPLLILLLIAIPIGYVVMRIGLRIVTGSLQQLTTESSRIAEGNLDHPLNLGGPDEVGQLGSTFEQMRQSLKGRIDEISRMLSVSQGVASAMEMEKAVAPILETALSIGASAARVVLAPAALPDFVEDSPSHFGLGPSAEKYAFLDAQLLAHSVNQPRVLLNNPTRAGLDVPAGEVLPQSLLAVPLRHEETHYGTLWIAFDEPHQIDQEDVRLITNLSGQAALAAANARLFISAQVGRQRMEAILTSTPDPVLVTDHRDRLLLANPAAVELFNANSFKLGEELGEVITKENLLELLRAGDDQPRSAEVDFSNGRIYYATASPVMIDGQQMGRVCILRDVTHFKELDALKSEFVSTVSHDLRSPLTLMRGYATMLDMVGELNEQQAGYVAKIVTGVESMSRLVNNLLDLGRIEAGVGLQLEMVPVADIARQVVEALQLQAAQKQITLNLQVPENTMPLVEADQALLQQAMHNLVENAVKYTENNGTVTVRLALTSQDVQFAVEDTGIGIAPVDQPRLFERFYRGGTRDARKQRGSGLGLTIVRSIAERHGGSVTVESQLGQGSVFILRIPMRQPQIED